MGIEGTVYFTLNTDPAILRQFDDKNCPACATIDTMKAIPPTVTTFAPGSGFAITQPK